MNFLLRSPDFGIVAGLAVFVLLCASLPYMSIYTRELFAILLFHTLRSTRNLLKLNIIHIILSTIPLSSFIIQKSAVFSDNGP